MTVGSEEDELAALGKGDRRAVVMLPADLSAAWQRREAATIAVHLDTSHNSPAGTALSVVQQVIEGVQREFTQQPSLVTVETHSVQAERFRPIDYIAPGILALSVAQLGLFGATTLVEAATTATAAAAAGHSGIGVGWFSPAIYSCGW